MRTVIFGEHVMNEVDSALSIEQVQEVLADVWPSIANAVGSENEDGDFVFVPKAAEKG